jgi:hypothetical protein
MEEESDEDEEETRSPANKKQTYFIRTYRACPAKC